VPAKKDDLDAQFREAFAREAESVVRCLFYARRADVEGRADIAAVLRSIADGEISQAFGHLEFLEEAGDPLAGGGDAAEWLDTLVDAESVHLGVLRRAASLGS
jgi:rubrerythrin